MVIDKLKLPYIPYDLQIHLIIRILRGHDSIFLAGTGYGKSLIFEAVAVLGGKKKVTIVECPSKALEADQVKQATDKGLSASFVLYSWNSFIHAASQTFFDPACNLLLLPGPPFSPPAIPTTRCTPPPSLRSSPSCSAHTLALLEHVRTPKILLQAADAVHTAQSSMLSRDSVAALLRIISAHTLDTDKPSTRPALQTRILRSLARI
ncbi:hypothetical protein DFH09DRAFT_1311870 [Mycena vulgaris]|nr:hypothetical protein DFH09DRAFT_1311870 [Mycena vulgaris]